MRLHPAESPLQDRFLGPVPQEAGRVDFDSRSLVCDGLPTGQTLPTFFLEGAPEARFEHIQLAEGGRVIPELSHPQALPLCRAGTWVSAGDRSIFLLQEQWEWLNPGRHLSLATTVKGAPPSLLVNRWFQFDPDSPRVSELWPVRDGLILEPVPLVKVPAGCRIISSIPDLQLDNDQATVLKNQALSELQEQLSQEIRRLYRALKSD